MGCVRCPWFSILLDGTSKGFFCASKGLRQGDPLLPFLFSLVANSLSALLSHAVWANLIVGFKIQLNELSISHLQFADDTIIFVKPSTTDINNLKLTLKFFELISRFKVNWSKLGIVGIHVENFTLQSLASSQHSWMKS